MTFYKHRHNQKHINARTDGLFSFTFVKQTSPQERNIFLMPIRIGQALTNITKYRQEIASIVLLRLYFFIKEIQKKPPTIIYTQFWSICLGRCGSFLFLCSYFGAIISRLNQCFSLDGANVRLYYRETMKV